MGNKKFIKILKKKFRFTKGNQKIENIQKNSTNNKKEGKQLITSYFPFLFVHQVHSCYLF